MSKKIKLLLIFSAIFSVRIIFLINWNYFLDADESVVGIMAKHITEGKHYPVFYYGQGYMGALESYVVALFFTIFNNISPFILKLIPLIFFFLTIIILYHLVEKYDRKNSLYWLLFFVTAPLFMIIWTMKARGGFMEVIFLSILFLFLLLKYREYKNNVFFYLACLVAGFSIYINALNVPFLLVVTYIYFLSWLNINKLPKLSLKFVVISSLMFLLGVFPSLYYHIIFPQFYKLDKLLSFANLGERIFLLFGKIIPLALGGGIGMGGSLFFYITEWMAVILFILAISLVFWKYKQNIIDLLLFRPRPYPLSLYFIILIPAYIVVLFFSVYLQAVDSVRYLVYFIICVPFVYFEAFYLIKLRYKKTAQVFLIAIILIGLINLSQFYIFKDRASDQHTEAYNMLVKKEKYNNLINFLLINNYKIGFTDYWIQWNLNFLSKEKLQFASFKLGGLGRNRYYDYYHQATQASNPVYILKIKESENIIKSLKFFKTQNYSFKIIDDFIIFIK